jgi:hypothetical protein
VLLLLRVKIFYFPEKLLFNILPVDGQVISQISRGLMVLVGVGKGTFVCGRPFKSRPD